MNTFLVGQKTIQDDLGNLRETVLARLDASEQTIITTIVDRLDQEQREKESLEFSIINMIR